MGNGPASIGIDVGGTKIFGARVTSRGHGPAVEAHAKVATPTEGPEAVVAAVAAMVAELGVADQVGVGAPGPVLDGTVLAAPNLPGWSRPVPLRDLVTKALDGPAVRVDNDVNVGTLGEHRAGAGRDAVDVLGVFVGTGVGGGLVLDSGLRRGHQGLAGEIGHTIVWPGGHRCGCGGRGHLEAYAGRAAIERLARARHESGAATALVELAGEGRMKSGVIAKALDAGDRVAFELLDDAVEALGIALASITTVLDLELIVVGGGLADKLGAGFVGRVEEAVRSRVFGVNAVRVVPAELGDEAGAIGAALLFDD